MITQLRIGRLLRALAPAGFRPRQVSSGCWVALRPTCKLKGRTSGTRAPRAADLSIAVSSHSLNNATMDDVIPRAPGNVGTLAPLLARRVDGHRVRDQRRERSCLELAELEAGRSGFAEHAAQRLTAGEHIYGNRWTERDLAELLAELSEEAADLGAWGVLALQALELDRLPDLARRRLNERLHATIRLGAQAHRELVRAGLELRNHLASCADRADRPHDQRGNGEHP